MACFRVGNCEARICKFPAVRRPLPRASVGYCVNWTVVLSGANAIIRRLLANFRNQVVDGVPRDRRIRYASPPTGQVRRGNVGMCVQVIRNGYFVVFERRGNESYTKGGLVCLERS